MHGAEGVGPRGTETVPPSIEVDAEPPSGATGVVPVLPSLSGLAAPTSAASGTLAAGACAEQPASSATATAGSPLLGVRGARRMAPSAPRLAGRTERDDGNIGGGLSPARSPREPSYSASGFPRRLTVSWPRRRARRILTRDATRDSSSRLGRVAALPPRGTPSRKSQNGGGRVRGNTRVSRGRDRGAFMCQHGPHLGRANERRLGLRRRRRQRYGLFARWRLVRADRLHVVEAIVRRLPGLSLGADHRRAARRRLARDAGRCRVALQRPGPRVGWAVRVRTERRDAHPTELAPASVPLCGREREPDAVRAPPPHAASNERPRRLHHEQDVEDAQDDL